MEIIAEPDGLHRLIKHAMDSGEASTLEEAHSIFAGYRLVVDIADATNPMSQSALLTVLTLAKRVFLGGVFVKGDLSASLMIPMPLGATLSEAVGSTGAVIGMPEEKNIPCISISNTPVSRSSDFHVRLVYSGWSGGIFPAENTVALSPQSQIMPLATMLAAAIAVNEAFSFVGRKDASSGRRPSGLNLWNPAADWLDEEHQGPILSFLPSRMWLIGLGHLGQAYLWALGLLPYEDSSKVELVLQDNDRITASTPSTSILSEQAMLGQYKTRAMALWAEKRGFGTRIHERLFDANYRRQPDEPSVALCGLDNIQGRQVLEDAGFSFIIEAGLGRDHTNFQTMRLHTLPGKRTARQIWKDATVQEAGAIKLPAYNDLLTSGRLNQCGLTLLAGKAVGAPFVGSIAACLVISELLRLLHGGQPCELIDLDLRSLDHRTIVRQKSDFSAFNPGFAVAKK